MLKANLKIGSGQVKDTVDGWGLVYVSADSTLASPVKDFEVTSYPEEEGEHIIPKTVDAPFDYKVKFFIQTSSLENANAKVAAFNAELCTVTDGVKEFKKVEFYNLYKGVKIVGYPKPISDAETFWRDSLGNALDAVVVEWTIRVTKPSECDFNYDSSN